MPANFNASEVFEMGIEIEKNGKAFYDEAAKSTKDAGVRKVFADLAEWECQHIVIFEKLKASLVGRAQAAAVYDPYNEVQLYIKAAADSHIFLQNTNTKKLAAECKTSLEALQIALSFEKDSVVLYRAMEEMVPEDLGHADVSRIIREELKHIAIIKAEMAEVSKNEPK